jgi:hypothetical protein
MSDGAFNLPVARESGSGRSNRLDDEGRVGFAGVGRMAGMGHEDPFPRPDRAAVVGFESGRSAADE